MDTQPAWVPEWIWAEFLKLRNFLNEYPDIGRDILLAKSVLEDKHCEAVWRAIDKRKGEPTRRYRQRCQQGGFRGDRWIGEAEELFKHLEYAASGIPAAEAIPASERRAIATKIERHASALRREMLELDKRCGHDGDPWCFTDGLQEMASAVANDFAPMNSDDLLGAAHKNHPIEGWDEFSSGVLIGFLNLSNALLAYANAADVWKRSRPEVARPNDEGARRLYFIRKMTNYFRKQYGTPLRESVAVLTSSIYKCDMDAATVAKLAP